MINSYYHSDCLIPTLSSYLVLILLKARRVLERRNHSKRRDILCALVDKAL